MRQAESTPLTWLTNGHLDPLDLPSWSLASRPGDGRIRGRAAELGSGVSAAPEFPHRPARVGAFTLIEPIASGGQAVVWRALGPPPERQRVAVKLLTCASRRNRRHVVRLCREAARARLLRHPSILPVYDFGEVDDMVYMAMPLVEGGTLRTAIEQRRRSLNGAGAPSPFWPAGLSEPEYLQAVVGLMTQIADAVAQAHEVRVVHRDVKPCNVLLDGRRRAYLADFGMGRDLDEAPPEALRDLCGTPNYMPPERLMGEASDPYKSDIYGAGMTLFEAIALRSPLDAPILRHPASIAAAFSGRQSRSLKSLCPHVPTALDEVVGRAIAFDPNERYPTARALANDLRDLERRLARAGGLPRAVNL